jgi:hypothetical protein
MTGRSGGRRLGDMGAWLGPMLVTLIVTGIIGAGLAPEQASGRFFLAGTYRGLTSSDDIHYRKLAFEVSRRSVFDFRFESGHRCSDGQLHRTGFVLKGKAAIDRSTGRFRFRLSSPAYEVARYSGRLKDDYAYGKLRIRYRTDPEGNPDPNGSLVCDTGRLTWRARLRRR